MRTMQRECLHCGQTFEIQNIRGRPTVTCSQACADMRRKAHQQRRRETAKVKWPKKQVPETGHASDPEPGRKLLDNAASVARQISGMRVLWYSDTPGMYHMKTIYDPRVDAR